MSEIFEIVNTVLEMSIELPLAEFTATDAVFGEATQVIREPLTINIDMISAFVEENTPPDSPPDPSINWKVIAASGGIASLVALNIYAASTYKGNDFPPVI